METITVQFNKFIITTNKSKMDLFSVHNFLSNHSGWSNNISLEKVRISIENSLCFGVFDRKNQI